MTFNSADANLCQLNYGDQTVTDGVASALWGFWIKVTSWKTAWQGIWTKDDYPTLAAGWGFQRDNANDSILWFVRGSGGSTTLYVKNGLVADGQWHHVAARAGTGGANVGMATFWDGVFTGQYSATIRNPFGNNAVNHLVWSDGNAIQIAQPVIYTGVTTAQCDAIAAALAKGVSPLSVGVPPVFYAPLSTDGVDTIGPTTPSVVGSAASFTEDIGRVMVYRQVVRTLSTVVQVATKRGRLFLPV